MLCMAGFCGLERVGRGYWDLAARPRDLGISRLRLAGPTPQMILRTRSFSSKRRLEGSEGSETACRSASQEQRAEQLKVSRGRHEARLLAGFLSFI